MIASFLMKLFAKNLETPHAFGSWETAFAFSPRSFLTCVVSDHVSAAIPASVAPCPTVPRRPMSPFADVHGFIAKSRSPPAISIVSAGIFKINLATDHKSFSIGFAIFVTSESPGCAVIFPVSSLILRSSASQFPLLSAGVVGVSSHVVVSMFCLRLAM